LRAFCLASLALVAASILVIACGPSLPKRPTTPARSDTSWKTMRAQHQVSLDVTKSDGTHDKRKLRGALAAERAGDRRESGAAEGFGPGKFRLRALGPAGITLFDLLYVDGRVKVMEAIKDPKASALGQVIESLAGDLSAALLFKDPGKVEGDQIVVNEGDRVVRLSKFVAISGHALPTRIDIENRKLNYRVGVDVSDLEIDVPLDPALFAE
jgi:hypothetical protein